MDPFAQSRADDDLFADDFEPITEPVVAVIAQSTVEVDQPTPKNADLPAKSNGQDKANQNDRRTDRRGRGGRGGGRGRGGLPQNGMANSKYAPKPQPTPSAAPIEEATLEAVTAETEAPPTETSKPPATPDVPARTPAVRGDRSATGGPAHKKLTEAELTAKMEKMAILNAQKTERHRLTEADEAAYQHREKELEKERRERAVVERKNARVMEMERAKNRERKMKAQGGREWDSEKKDEDIVDRKGRSSEYVRGGHGGVKRTGLEGSRFAVRDDEDGDDNNLNGRGGFEGRGRGRGRGGRGRGNGRGGKPPTAQAVPTAEDFPALSSAALPSPVAGGDWAEEMATPVEEKKQTEP